MTALPSMFSALGDTVWSVRALYVACGVLGSLILRRAFVAHVRRRSMPPGPRGLPFIGALLEVPTTQQWLKFNEWKDIYGPIFTVNLVGQNVIVLNSHEVVNDLFDRRSADFSHRPRMVVAYEFMSGCLAMVLRSYDKAFTRRRRAVGEVFSIRSSERFQTMQAHDAALSILDILQSPLDSLASINKVAAVNIVAIVYGVPRTDKDSVYLAQRMRKMMNEITYAMVTAKYLVDFFPVLKHVPLQFAKWKRDALNWHDRTMELFVGLNRDVEAKMAAGDPTPSFARQLIVDKERNELDERERAWLGGEMCIAGTDTLSSVVVAFTMAMVLHPHVMRRAQAQLDAVVGRDRLPSFDDKDSLPYLQAVVRETLRWRPAAPMTSRYLEHDETYKEYLLPKGSIILGNIWALNHDPSIYEEPEDFRPERFLDDSGHLAIPASNETRGMGHASFGHGRRVCPGSPLANQMLFIEMAMLLWAFDIELPTGADGQPILPDRFGIVDHGVTVSPKPFDVIFKPRFSDVEAVTKRELEGIDVHAPFEDLIAKSQKA